ncbi:50S ribosome-binding GTPase [Candidatus Pacearchaeota archaeon]|nr:50S ribosome-binding GTPase [Candidatus Pacearchaeota archaeon]
MPINASFQYQQAELAYLNAKTTEEKIEALKVMLKLAPKHKSSENLVAGLKRRLAKLKEEQTREREISKRRGHSLSIKKEGDAQITFIGLTNSGKSSLLNRLTNANASIMELPFTTKKPEIGTLDLGAKIQVVELPPLKLNKEDKEFLSIANNSDLICIIVTSSGELKSILDELKEFNIIKRRLVILNKREFLTQQEEEKLRRLSFFLKISALNDDLGELKQKIFENLKIIRIYTKERNKISRENPLILKEESTIKDACGRIHKDFVKNFRFAKIWGQSAKFPGQKVGKGHILQDQDVLEVFVK